MEIDTHNGKTIQRIVFMNVQTIKIHFTDGSWATLESDSSVRNGDYICIDDIVFEDE